MRIVAKRVFKIAIFIVIVISMIWVIGETTVAKYLYDTDAPLTHTYKDFYSMDKNTVDVIILGTSHAGAGFVPQDFYNRNGLRTYNLASPAQRVWISYYWLEEALKYQKPSVVIFECNYLFFDEDDDDSARRKALDNMRIGMPKLRAIEETVRRDVFQEATISQYIKNNDLYHSRWEELDSDDFVWMDNGYKHSLLKGGWIEHNIMIDNEHFMPFNMETSNERAEFAPVSLEYLDRMVELCADNNIQLILTKTPIHTFKSAEHNAIKDYAEQNGISFVDFNSKDIYESIDFNYNGGDMNDISDGGAHANVLGARKMSYYLSDYIVDNGYAIGTEDAQWEESRHVSDEMLHDFELVNTYDADRYLELLNDDRYTVMMVVVGENVNFISETEVELLNELGLGEHISNELLMNRYLAIIDRGSVINESWSDANVEYKGSFDGGKKRLLVRGMSYSKNEASIMIDNVEYSLNELGLNIVVYSNQRNCVIDSVAFNVTDDGVVFTR